MSFKSSVAFAFVAVRLADEFLFTQFSVQVTSMLSVLFVTIGLAFDDQLTSRGVAKQNLLQFGEHLCQ
jgi:hypothetical protein